MAMPVPVVLLFHFCLLLPPFSRFQNRIFFLSPPMTMTVTMPMPMILIRILLHQLFKELLLLDNLAFFSIHNIEHLLLFHQPIITLLEFEILVVIYAFNGLTIRHFRPFLWHKGGHRLLPLVLILLVFLLYLVSLSVNLIDLAVELYDRFYLGRFCHLFF